MKIQYIISSIIVVGLLVWGGYYFSSGPKNTDDTVTVQLMATTTPDSVGQGIATSSPDTATTSVTTNQIKKTHMITLDTNYGSITFETYDADAPNTVNNFVTLATKGFYNNLTFHRVIKGFMIQGGDPLGNGTGGPGYTFADELNPNTSSYKAGYKKGVIAMANSGPDTNGSQFFIMAADYPLPNDYTIFGKVVSGQSVVDAIDSVKTDGSDKPISPVIIKKVTVK